MTKAGAAAAPRGRIDTGHRWDPFRLLWRLFTSVRFAFLLTGALAFFGLLGVLIPQIPIQMRGNEVATESWLQMQEGRFGPLADVMHGIGLFNVFNTWWFRVSLGVLVVSVSVCTANRLPPTLRNVFRPRQRVPDSYFDRARSRLDVAVEGEVSAVEGALRRRRYKVSRFEEGEATYLFADRFPWAQLATFVSHLGLIVFLAGAVVSLFLGSESQILVGEGATAPVGRLNDPRHMQVRVFEAVEGRDEAGRVIEYRSDLAVFRNGVEVCRGSATVNSPLGCEGYRFHQSFFSGDGARLSVADALSGRKLYDETLALDDTMPLPEVVIRDAATGAPLFHDYLPLTQPLEGAWLTLLQVPGRDSRVFVGVRGDGADADRWSLVVFEVTFGADEISSVAAQAAASERIRLVVPEGETAEADGLEFEFLFLTGAPATIIDDLPGGRSALLQMPVDLEGRRYASLAGFGGESIALRQGESRQIGDQVYTFEGQRDFTGITVKRDPGSKIIWVAGAMLLAGLVVTFYAPRRRLWAKIGPGRLQMAGVAERTVNFRKEMRAIARDAGCADIEPEDEDDD